MPEYRRWREAGATYFFTVVTEGRRPLFADGRARELLRDAFAITRGRLPFENWAAVLLPDHLHCIWRLPPRDDDFSTRWSMLKRTFSKEWRRVGEDMAPVSNSRRRHRETGVWQRRFWEHLIRDESELYAYRDYIHLNPVKHGYVSEPHEWQWSSVHRHIKLGWLQPNWTTNVQVNIDVGGEA